MADYLTVLVIVHILSEIEYVTVLFTNGEEVP